MKVPSNKTFSIASEIQSNWQNNRCQFCMYRDTIFQQLGRLKQAIMIKNQQIKDLQEFIKKISKMAFINNSNNLMNNESRQDNMQLSRQVNSLVRQINQLPYHKKNYQKQTKELNFQESDEISFRFSKTNIQQQSQTLNKNNKIKKFNKLHQLNEMKKQIQQKLKQTPNIQKNKFYQIQQSKQSTIKFESIRTLSEPHQQGMVGLIQNMHQNNELSSQKSNKSNWVEKVKRNFEDEKFTYTQSLQKDKLISKKEQSDQISIDIIKRFIKQKIK